LAILCNVKKEKLCRLLNEVHHIQIGYDTILNVQLSFVGFKNTFAGYFLRQIDVNVYSKSIINYLTFKKIKK